MKAARRLRLLAYPRLRELPPERWDSALVRARDTAFDAIEWAGMAFGIAVVTYALRPGAGDAEPFFALYLMQFFMALPLLAVFVGPFLLRRTRRGLDLQLARHNGGDQWSSTHARHRSDGPQHSSSTGPE